MVRSFFQTRKLLDDKTLLQSLTQIEHWLSPVEGREKIQFDYTSKLIELPDLNSPGTWSIKYKNRLDRALVEVTNYKVLSERLIDLYIYPKGTGITGASHPLFTICR